jgi:hypothetical protein
MATPCTGVTVLWNSVSFQEVVSVKPTLGGSLPITRSGQSPIALDMGSIEIACLHSANCTLTNYGKRATFQVQGPGLAFTHKAIFERLQVQKQTNDVERYTVTLRLAPI